MLIEKKNIIVIKKMKKKPKKPQKIMKITRKHCKNKYEKTTENYVTKKKK